MNQPEIAAVLAQIDDLKTLDVERLQSLSGLCSLESLSENSVLYRENEKTSDVYYLISGLVEARVRIPSRDSEDCIRTHKPGRLFGETAFLDSGRRGTTSVVRERSLVLRIQGTALSSLCHQDAVIGSVMYRWLGRFAAEHSRDATIELRNSLGNF
ncbi:MAG: hypothetical protein A2087_11490 [Spirochaetes bacterium GWD1_61_31]|nr:MAG: hypothetical protein A2Y37_14720 [Spirochaetes bacterium GWB1_60_80]OHD29316.1 MAG: hypothetical protein A2004_08220 [Spirochaetes bacterium GWC1_61_12]OHD35824.1 MAG: hypothetical protein A2087_11490 [Spirochaetes bacterium GWD1_61_31]OHD46765.1 MAG: hypothetical protein A2Y35_10660 [Spirochaetes bacterium GWE1_60_18]OHD61217.1 MAG: hypothetical protein A2Y32_12955 [Spirochaetes bacterium GWF1_60_12]